MSRADDRSPNGISPAVPMTSVRIEIAGMPAPVSLLRDGPF
jgi:hypothetical protein